jgi:hypothetical protein
MRQKNSRRQQAAIGIPITLQYRHNEWVYATESIPTDSNAYLGASAEK